MLGPIDGVDVNALLDHLPQWTHVTQPPYDGHDFVDDVVNLCFRREATHAEA